METRGLAQCPNCGHRVFELFKLTAEDIQRVHSPEEMGIYWGVCWDCREKFRSAARLEVDYATSKALRDVALFTLFFSVTLFLLKLLLPSPIIFVYGSGFLHWNNVSVPTIQRKIRLYPQPSMVDEEQERYDRCLPNGCEHSNCTLFFLICTPSHAIFSPW